MVNWHIYNEQSYKCKGLASQAFIGNLLAHINTKIVYRLPLWLEKRSDDHNTIEKMKRNKYFYKKYNGELIKKRKAVTLVDNAIPHISDILSHPLWMLLSRSICSHDERLIIAKRLPFTVQSHILNREGDAFIFRDNLLKFLNMNTYDALTGTLLVLLAHPEQFNNTLKQQTSAALLRFIIRFITPKNVKLAVELNIRLFKLLGLKTSKETQYTCTFNLNDKDWSLPLYLNPSFDHDSFKAFLGIYEMLYQSINTSTTFEDKNVPFEQVMTYVEHTSLPSLTKKLTGKLPKQKHRVLCPLHQLIRRLSYDTIMDNAKQDTDSPLYNHIYRY
jgi:hypothetical protein